MDNGQLIIIYELSNCCNQITLNYLTATGCPPFNFKCPGWKRKAFCGKNVFFLKPETQIPKLREKRFTVFKKKTFLAKSLKRTAG